MPWNSNQGGNGGGPWGNPPGGGGGGQSPWGRPGGSGGPNPGPGQQPPDFEELIRKGQDRFRKAVPGGFGGRRGIGIGLVVLLLVWLATGIYRVQPDEVGVVMRFGEFVRTEQPGLRYALPAPIERVEKPTVTRVNRIEIGFRSEAAATAGFRSRAAQGARDVPEESLMLTGDENIIDIDFVVLWKIDAAAPEDFLFNIRRPEETVQKAAESAMREVIGRTPIQQALTEDRNAIQRETQLILQAMLDEYQAGVTINGVELQDVKAPEQVIDAFDDVQRARADRERATNEAEAYRNRIVPEARGAAERILQAAQAYREEVIARATGEAERFRQVYQAYDQSRDVTGRRLYLETLEQVLERSNKIIIGSDVGSNGGTGGVVPYLPLDQLNRNRGANSN